MNDAGDSRSTRAFHLLLQVHPTVGTDLPSGLPSLQLRLVREFAGRVPLSLLKWDEEEGQPRHFDERDLLRFFCDAEVPPAMPTHRYAWRKWYRFDEALPRGSCCLLLYSEDPRTTPEGNEMFSRLLTLCQDYGVPVLTLFLAPPSDPSDPRTARHAEYLERIARSDWILPLSLRAEADLRAHYRRLLCGDGPECAFLMTRILAAEEGGSATGIRKRALGLLQGCCEEHDTSVRVLRESLVALLRASGRGPAELPGKEDASLIRVGEDGSLLCILPVPPALLACRSVVVFPDMGEEALDRLVAEHGDRIFDADSWFLPCRELGTRLVRKAATRGHSRLLPTHFGIYGTEGELEEKLPDRLLERHEADERRCLFALRERVQQSLARPLGLEARDRPLLSIVLSTYNRGPFVRENVRWLLELIGRISEPVDLVVVDNASTDRTRELLQPFCASGKLHLIRNPSNVGMLGNLRVCATLLRGRFMWITGDDDYIVPEGLARVLGILRQRPRLPFLFVNFGVYHRARLNEGDRAPGLIAERTMLAPHPSPDGLVSVARAAEEHDNLFTAIYPIIFRSDLLPACFNYPFDGVPFSDLVECIPTTRFFLGNYSACDAWWLGEPGIVGNAHNSWSRYRPRWHSVIMPRAFELAREAGVRDELLFRWSQLHFDFFQEAAAEARHDGVEVRIEEDELDVASRVFRRQLSLDEAKRGAPPS